MSLKAISLFSGGGGLDLGLEAAGFEIKLATDVDSFSCKTLEAGKLAARKLNKQFLNSTEILETNIIHLEPQMILDRAHVAPGEIDLMVGGPPCQAFSVFGKRQGRGDPRGMLVYEYLRQLAYIRPKVFMFENVYGILTVEHGEVFKEVCQKLAEPIEGLKYTLSVLRLNAVDYGVPQSRDRVFIIGDSRGKQITDVPIITSRNPTLFEDTVPWRTVADAFRGLPPMGTEGLANHIGRKHSQRIIDRYSTLRPGERDSKTRINKLDLQRPSFTIIVGSDKGGGKGHVHPIEPREVTARESARIQTFPDWWAFSGTSRHPIRQIGNAVPPLLGAVVGNEIRAQLFGLKKKNFKEIVKQLDQEHMFPEYI